MKELREQMRQWLKENPDDIGEAYDIEGEDYQTGENNLNWKGGLRTNDPKEYDRQRHKKNYVPKGMNDKTGKNNPNWKGGVWSEQTCAEYFRQRRAKV
jgi:hypothetical protein